MTNTVKIDRKTVLLLLLATAFSVSVALAAISQFPLFLIQTSPPNVMILLDNSGSMDIIMQHPGYDPSIAYTGTFRNETYYQKIIYQAGQADTYELEAYRRADYVGGTAVAGETAVGKFVRDGIERNLPLPYVNTRWDGNYLNWIFYHASESQQQSLTIDPGLRKTRIQTAQGVISNLVKNVSGVHFGLAKFNETTGGTNPQGGKVVATCGNLTPDNVEATVNAIVAETWTPIGEALAEMWHYFKGGTSPYNTGTTYTSPITASCQKNFIVLVTDGEPVYDGCYRGDFTSYNCSNTMSAASRMVDVAGYMHTHNAVSTFSGSHVDTYAIGLTYDSTALRNTAANGGGEYYTTASGISLDTALQNALTSIISRTASGSAASVSTGYLTSTTRLYRGMFDSSTWAGKLECWALSTSDLTKGDLVGYPTTPLWEAGALLDARADARTIYTAGTISGVYKRFEFTTGQLSTFTSAGFTNYSSNWIDYVRGEPLNGGYPAGYRARTSRLGDVVNSPPTIFGPPNGLYDENNYNVFKRTGSTRQVLILAGANDGMLHAFDATTGDEKWAFIPQSLLGKLKLLRSVPYLHTNFVNGAITIGDAFIHSKDATTGEADNSAAWHSIVICGLREGGKSFFALDLTDPQNPIPLWEVSSSSANGLGYSFGTPLIVKVRDSSKVEGERWVAILPNGYESPTTSRTASLIIVDLASGTILREIVVDTAHPNGLASPAAIDKNGDGIVDTAYAGDLKGQVWKFDLSDGTPSRWSASVLLAAKDAASAPQPITTAPEVVLRADYQIVLVGTGKYMESSDKSNTQTQSFYAVFDENRNLNSPLTRANLTQQTVTQVTYNDKTWRTSSDNVLGTGKSGWFVDLPIAGERVLNDPIARSRKIIYTTFIPASDPCSPGGVSWLMELNLESGGTVLKPAFDVTGDDLVNSSDLVAVGDGSKMPTGTLLGEGLAATPAIVGTDGGLEYKFISRSTGEITKLVEGGGTSQFGPRSWRFVRMSGATN